MCLPLQRLLFGSARRAVPLDSQKKVVDFDVRQHYPTISNSIIRYKNGSQRARCMAQAPINMGVLEKTIPRSWYRVWNIWHLLAGRIRLHCRYVPVIHLI